MAAFQSTRKQTEQKVMLHLLSEVEGNPSITQRNLAAELGIALGLMNTYLKRCIMKGWIRSAQISPRRITYFLTPEGFTEKSSMVRDYLARSLTFFRDARSQCEDIFIKCLNQGFKNIALIGDGDLADIAKLVAYKTELNVSLIKLHNTLSGYDAILITDILNPQGTYDMLCTKVDSQKILTLSLLHISQKSINTLYKAES